LLSDTSGKFFVSCLALIAIVCTSTPRTASATWSIVAADPKTGEVGGAVATCTPWAAYVVSVIPGKGVIVTQAASNKVARSRGALLIEQGASAQDTIDSISDERFDPTHSRQQHGVVVLSTRESAAGYTGADTGPFAGDVQRKYVSVQGNILTGPSVLSAALEAFQSTGQSSESTLADRLMAALEAGASKGGDRRCGSQTAISAYLVVAGPSDMASAPKLRLAAPIQSRGGKNAVEVLRLIYDAEMSR
jgi:uncharacterized Ntn-hydrolase superfamily protein